MSDALRTKIDKLNNDLDDLFYEVYEKLDLLRKKSAELQDMIRIK